VRVFPSGRQVEDSTFAEDSDVTPRRRPLRTMAEDREGSTTEGVTDLERRVEALRVWAGLEEERKAILVSSLQRRLAGLEEEL
jgi:hypothetical protein